MKQRFLIVFLLGVSPLLILAQSKQKLNLEGDFYFDTDNFVEAEDFYSQSVDKKPDFQSLYNVGVSQEKQQKVEEAVDNYQQAIPYADDDLQKSIAYYNMANTIFEGNKELTIEKLEDIISHYKNAIKLNPNLQEAKHNLAAAQISLDMAQQQEQQQQQQQQDQDQEQQEKNEDQQDQEQQDQQQPNEDEQQQDQSEDQKPNEDQSKEQKASVDKNEIENILKMVDKEDSEVQQKMRKQSKSEDKVKRKKW